MSDRIPSLTMADEIDLMIYAKTAWLADFGQGPKKRPDFEIDLKRRELAVLKQAAFEYRASAEKLRQMQEAAE
ncbi:hypothetical protein [Mesorhizobium caraganae]|uniref:hypothetical protein n=1 Tax=Mesorhizobium caraganae TaxID=483206 RepID=UPI001780EF5D|nr:hypothetical protein [Mesorhizobium caraganae]